MRKSLLFILVSLIVPAVSFASTITLGDYEHVVIDANAYATGVHVVDANTRVYVGYRLNGDTPIAMQWTVTTTGGSTNVVSHDLANGTGFMPAGIAGNGADYWVVAGYGDATGDHGQAWHSTDLANPINPTGLTNAHNVMLFAVNAAGTATGASGGTGSITWSAFDGPRFIGNVGQVGTGYGIDASGDLVTGQVGLNGSGVFVTSLWYQGSLILEENVASIGLDVETVLGDIFVTGQRDGYAGYWENNAWNALTDDSGNALQGALVTLTDNGWMGGYIGDRGVLYNSTWSTSDWLYADDYWGLDYGTILSINGLDYFGDQLYGAGMGSAHELQTQFTDPGGAVVPEPATAVLVAMGLVGTLVTRRHSKAKAEKA